MTIEYDASRRALYQPETAPSVFGRATGAGEDAIAVEAARLAYRRFEESAAERERLNAALARAGFGPATFFEHDATDGQGFGCIDAEGLALLAFRGTQPERAGDLASDGDVRWIPWDDGKVHAGFAATASGLWPQVQAWLDDTAARRQRLLACGHSLGAAIATLLARRAGAARLVTIGSPRVGNAAFAAAHGSLPVTRIVHCCDVVTEVPPPLLGFVHVGEPTYIDRKGHLHPGAGEAFMLADRLQARVEYVARHAFRRGAVLTRDLADHAPINYVRAYWT